MTADSSSDYARLSGLLKSQLQTGEQNLQAELAAGKAVDQLVKERAIQVTQVLRISWQKLLKDTGELALVAVGGFGRGELHPYSDIDLLVLSEDQLNQASQSNLETWIGVLWDAGLVVSHSVRSLQTCYQQAQADVTITTNLMEARLLAGNDQLYQLMQRQIAVDQMWAADDFFAAKLAEQQQRHASFDDTAYRLEPNIKEGPGGLRDIQTIAWVARRYFGDADLATLVGHGFLLPDEYNELIKARNFLWHVRWINHTITNRAEERLLFAQQKQLAAELGYTDKQQATRAVEQFMQQYYRTVTHVERLNERLLQQYDEELLTAGAGVIKVLDGEFQVREDYLEARHPKVFDERPLAIMDLFLRLQVAPDIRGVRAGTIRWLRQALQRHGEALSKDSLALIRLLDILRQPTGVYSQLARMNRYGLLGRLIPEFARVTGLMQFDLFHVYTVDQHTLFVIRNLRRFAHAKYTEKFNHAANVFQRIDQPELLYLAALFHDIAKGRGGDHSELGAEYVHNYCQQLNLPASQVQMISWLVQQHLLMSRTAQREDLSDPDVIHRFARSVADREQLDYLYLLTVADIAATNPDLWNSWKDALLWELYQKTASALQQGLSRPLQRIEVARETRSRVFSQLLALGVDVERMSSLWRTFPEQAFQRFDDRQLLWITRILLAHAELHRPVVQARLLPEQKVTELLVTGISFDGFFATVIGQLEQMRCNVFNARIQTTNENLVVDLFQLVDAGGYPLNQSDIDRLQTGLESLLSEAVAPTPMNFSIPRRLREFLSNADIRFSNYRESNSRLANSEVDIQDPDGLTRMEVVCTDRPGLLSSIAQVLLQQKVRLHDARIATFGEQVEDTFKLSDYANQPLDATRCAALQQALQQALDTPPSIERHTPRV